MSEDEKRIIDQQKVECLKETHNIENAEEVHRCGNQEQIVEERRLKPGLIRRRILRHIVP